MASKYAGEPIGLRFPAEPTFVSNHVQRVAAILKAASLIFNSFNLLFAVTRI